MPTLSPSNTIYIYMSVVKLTYPGSEALYTGSRGSFQYAIAPNAYHTHALDTDVSMLDFRRSSCCEAYAAKKHGLVAESFQPAKPKHSKIPPDDAPEHYTKIAQKKSSVRAPPQTDRDLSIHLSIYLYIYIYIYR